MFIILDNASSSRKLASGHFMDKWAQRTFEQCRVGDHFFVYIDQGIAFRLERVDAMRCNPFIRIEDSIPRDQHIGMTIRRCHALVMSVLSPVIYATTQLRFVFLRVTDLPHDRENTDVTRFIEDIAADPRQLGMGSDASFRMWYRLERGGP